MSAKIDVREILKGHFATMHDVGAEKPSPRDLAVFYAVPALSAVLIVVLLNKPLTTNAINIMAAVFSIFVGLLLNLLVIIFDVLKSLRKPPGDKTPLDEDSQFKKQLLKETFSNICYCILISVVLILLMFVSKMGGTVVNGICSVISYFLVGNFFLTLLMVLKRVHALLVRESC